MESPFSIENIQYFPFLIGLFYNSFCISRLSVLYSLPIGQTQLYKLTFSTDFSKQLPRSSMEMAKAPIPLHGRQQQSYNQVQLCKQQLCELPDTPAAFSSWTAQRPRIKLLAVLGCTNTASLRSEQMIRVSTSAVLFLSNVKNLHLLRNKYTHT